MIPDIIFKYRSFSDEFNLRTLFNYEIFMASTNMFNDPFEGAIPFVYREEDITPPNLFLKLQLMMKEQHPDWSDSKIHEECYLTQKKELLNDETHLRKLAEDHKERMKQDFGIFSLAKEPLNYLMWSHYANSHNGYCIGFDSKLLYETIGGRISIVRYEDDLPRIPLFGDSVEYMRDQLFTKGKFWEYENEYRLVKTYCARKVITYPKEMIKKIYLGCSLPILDKNKIINFIKEEKINCKIYDLSLDNNKFKLNEMLIY